MMTDYRMKAETGKFHLGGSADTGLILTHSAEIWQFWAFVFAAILTLAFAVADELLAAPGWGRLGAKVALFIGLGYFTMFNRWAQGRLIRLLRIVKEQRR